MKMVWCWKFTYVMLFSTWTAELQTFWGGGKRDSIISCLYSKRFSSTLRPVISFFVLVSNCKMLKDKHWAIDMYVHFLLFFPSFLKWNYYFIHLNYFFLNMHNKIKKKKKSAYKGTPSCTCQCVWCSRFF